MKRVGNRPAQLVRSASRRKKAAARFLFDVTVHKVTGVKPNATYYLKWTRGLKVAQTTALSSTPEAAKSGLSFEQKISLMVTLYREDGKKFDQKDAKLSLVAVNSKKQERTVGKVHFDISAFAGVPSASSVEAFKLSTKFVAHATVDSRFVKAAGKGPGSAGASSALSGISTRTDDDDDDQFDDDEFDDLALDDVPEPVVASSSSAKPRRPLPPTRSPSTPASPVMEPLKITPVPLPMEKKKSVSPKKPKPLPSPVTAGRTLSNANPSATGAPRRERPQAITGTEVNLFSKTADKEKDARISALLKENEKIVSDFTRFKSEKHDVEDSHKKQVHKLNSKLEQRSREVSFVESKRASVDAGYQEISRKHHLASQRLVELNGDIDSLKKERDLLKGDAEKLLESQREVQRLSREVDRLTLLQAQEANKGDAAAVAANERLEKRMTTLQEDKARLERRVSSHERHVVQVRGTYEKLSKMYDELRGENARLVKAAKSKETDRGLKVEAQSQLSLEKHGESLAQLEDVRREVQDVQASRQSLQSDYDHLKSQFDGVQEKLATTSAGLDELNRENEQLYSDIEDLKGQRDVALQKALSKGKNVSSQRSHNSRAVGKVEEDLRLAKEKFDRENSRLQRRLGELEAQTTEVREDAEYEKSEKLKAREERDQIRESARALERRTSLHAKQNDAMQFLKRKLSTYQMREQDLESMNAALKQEVQGLQEEVREGKVQGSGEGSSSVADELAETVSVLVDTKIALAMADEDKLHLQFQMKKQKKSERLIQEKLAAHASRLEVKLGHATEEVDKLRRNQSYGAGSDFNEVDSDVDY